MIGQLVVWLPEQSVVDAVETGSLLNGTEGPC